MFIWSRVRKLRRYYLKILALRRKELGGEHADVAELEQEVAGEYSILGRATEALMHEQHPEPSESRAIEARRARRVFLSSRFGVQLFASDTFGMQD